ncbi:hypothetical protein [Bacteroides pyogenes]|uniref:Uncharacterized protein n=1 Tax=Bacteroides pyogenes TaxID=310300 RepID=A0A5D3E987_9BACE|nr:hypothetical protein [Bacteroides pyogenes]TYK32378.1 hypothetical protein FNJ60_12185 [Bacteroides pyogenes]
MANVAELTGEVEPLEVGEFDAPDIVESDVEGKVEGVEHPAGLFALYAGNGFGSLSGETKVVGGCGLHCAPPF